MDQSPLGRLPDELLEAIVYHLPPTATIAFGGSCRRCNNIASQHLVWRRHCVREWRYWEPRHEIAERLSQPPAQTQWRRLHDERQQTDERALEGFNELLQTQQHRLRRIETTSDHGYDVKDLLLRLRDHTPDDAEDALARRYHANVLLSRIHRATAIDKWTRLVNQQMVRLEEVLGAYDLFVLDTGRGDLHDIDAEFDRIAQQVRAASDDFDSLSTRLKAVEIARYLRAENLVGNPNEEEYHALRNNFLSIALFDEPHSSMPLQTVAIYCAVARRLGVNARPSNYPTHVHAVVEAPADRTLDGAARSHDPNTDGFDPETMHMDPWRSDEEVPHEHLTLRLTQMGAPPGQHAFHLSATTMVEVVTRAGRNIMNSVQVARDRMRDGGARSARPDIDAAWYSMLWSMVVLGDGNAAASLHRRRQCLPYLIEHFHANFPEDLGLLVKHVAPLFEREREHDALLHLVFTDLTADNAPRPLRPRHGDGQPVLADSVRFRVGQHFQHTRYAYTGVVIGWDARCSAALPWIRQMRVDELPLGREQPFYHVLADDKSVRYVAQENVHLLDLDTPCDSLLQFAGRYFKRWDAETKVFVSNIRDEYPDD